MDQIVLFKEEFCRQLNLARNSINGKFADKEPWQLIACTFAATCVAVYLYMKLSWPKEPLGKRVKRWVFSLARKIPSVRDKIQRELDGAKEMIESEFHKNNTVGKYYVELPENGMSVDKVVEKAAQYEKMGKVKYMEGKASGAVYFGEDDLTVLSTKVFNLYCWSNPLHPDIFPGCRKMEAEIVRMTCNLFHGSSESCGSVTSGGTESILLACLAYRNLAYSKGIRYPQILAPITVHAAFDKAAEYFGMRLTHIPIDKETFKVDTKIMQRSVSASTCLLVASAPNFPHGIIDPVEDVAKIGRKYDIPVHVDACLGGFLICFMDECGFDIKPFDFRVSGVTSISADTHKYGYSSKGTSVIMYSDKKYLHHQYFCQPDWPGGIYASPTLSGSRSGANIAVCWASLMYTGRNGYVEKTDRIINTTRTIVESLREIEGITVLGDPQVSVVAFTSYIFNIYSLCDQMTKRGWNLNALQFPNAVHLCVTAKHVQRGVAETFLSDVRSISEELMKNPYITTTGVAAIYGTTQSVPDRTLIHEMAFLYLDAYYSTEMPNSQIDEDANTKEN